MNGIAELKIFTDAAMMLALLGLMCYQATGGLFHECLGCAMFLLFLLHNYLNRGWYAALLRGGWTPLRVVQTLLNLTIFVLMAAEMASGVAVSEYAFAFLGQRGGLALARSVHLACAWWCFTLMSLHAGLHWGFVCSAVGPAVRRFRGAVLAFKAAATALAACGAVLFCRSGAISYMTLRVKFAFYDFEESGVSVFGSYLAMAVCWAFIGALCFGALQKAAARSR